MPRRSQQVIEHRRIRAARSVVTSIGRTLIVPSARSKNRRAAAASRRGETNTSMTYPT
jgi:hypothetical protein